MKSNDNGASGLTLLILLTIIFTALKFFGAIDWSWWWVTVPLWGAAAVIVGLALAGAGIYIIFRLVELLVVLLFEAILYFPIKRKRRLIKELQESIRNKANHG